MIASKEPPSSLCEALVGGIIRVAAPVKSKDGLCLVEWQDSARPVAEWRFLDDAPTLDVVRCVSVGWVVSESDDVLMLAPNIGDAGGDSAQGCGFIRIPKTAITRRASLVEAA